jgi:hypothetical protein
MNDKQWEILDTKIDKHVTELIIFADSYQIDSMEVFKAYAYEWALMAGLEVREKS